MTLACTHRPRLDELAHRPAGTKLRSRLPYLVPACMLRLIVYALPTRRFRVSCARSRWLACGNTKARLRGRWQRRARTASAILSARCVYHGSGLTGTPLLRARPPPLADLPPRRGDVRRRCMPLRLGRGTRRRILRLSCCFGGAAAILSGMTDFCDGGDQQGG